MSRSRNFSWSVSGRKSRRRTDLEALFGARRAPRRLHAADDLLETVQRGLPALAPYLDVTSWDREHEEGLWDSFGGLGERLRETEVSFERSARQPLDMV